MTIPWLQLFLVIFLTFVNAFFAGSEIAFVSLRSGQVQRLDEAGGRSRKVAEMAQNPNSFFSACQIGITLAGLFASATAAVALSEPLQHVLEPLIGSAAYIVAFMTVTLILAYFTLVFGELVPKRVAMQRAEQWAHGSVTLLHFITQAARPLVWLLQRSSDLVVRILGSDPSRSREEVTEEELRDMLASQETVSAEQRSIIDGAFEIDDRTLREIVVPRGQVVGIVQTMRASDAMNMLAEAGHSRAPVHTGDLDDVLGIAHLRDLVNYNGVVANRVRPATVLPESINVLEALRRMQNARQQMALVVNEHGGVEGIVTLEDLMEEIVGEIYDEFDRELASVVSDDDGSHIVPGSFPVHDLCDIGVDLPDGDGAYATVAGYVLSVLGHIPEVGEIAEGERWDAVVLSVEEHAITEVKLVPIPEASDDETLP